MIRLLWVSLMFCVATTGCSRDPYQKYLGLWERVGALGGHQVLELKRDGETIVFNDNVLVDRDFLDQPKQGRVLTQSEGRLSLETGFGGAAFGLSEGDEYLRVADQKFRRVEPKQLDEIRAKIVAEREEAEQNRARCKELDAQWDKDRAAVPSGGFAEAEKVTAKKREIFARYEEKAKAVPDCDLYFGW